jgi:hypothetical protein
LLLFSTHHHNEIKHLADQNATQAKPQPISAVAHHLTHDNNQWSVGL